MKLAAYIIILFSFILLQSCATTDLGGDAEKKAIAKKTLKEVPKWFENLPKSKKILYAKGTAVSQDMQTSMDKATIAAKRNLADKLDSYISSKTKLFLKEVGTGEISDIYNEMEQATINTIKEAHIIGFDEYKSKTIEIGSNYRTYTVVEFLYGKANKILISQIKNNDLLEGSVSAGKAFQDLEKEIQGN